MRIKIETIVQQDYQIVWDHFDEDLFMALKPPLMPFKLLQFDGCKAGDEVKVKVMGMNFHSKITSSEQLKEEYYFVDEGSKLPFFLTYWRHKHRVIKQGDHCLIIDDIEYRSHLKFLELLLYPNLYLQFLYRTPIYKHYFKRF